MPSEWTERYRCAAPEVQARFLARLALELTVVARGTHPQAATDTADAVCAETLQAVNELQHRIAGQLVHLLSHDPHRYPDDVFCAMFDHTGAESPALRQGLEWAIEEAAWELDLAQ